MKILFVGQLAEGQTSRMRMNALAGLGHTIIPHDSHAGWHAASWIARHSQQRLGFGPTITGLNSAVVNLSRTHRPDLLWAEKQEYIHPDTLDELRERGVRLLHFTPDPYFALSWKRTRLADRCLPKFDYVVTSKQYELADYRLICRTVLYMPLGFCDEEHRPALPRDDTARRTFSADVGFVGGWEPRRETLLDSVSSLGCELKIWGNSWDHLIDGRMTVRRALRLRQLAGGAPFSIARRPSLAKALQGGEIYGQRYAWALSGAAIGIGFLRHVCPDQHTTRSFEIPACRSMLLADRTPEHQELFEEGREAEFFASGEELVDKVRFYLAHQTQREQIADRGFQRCHDSRYSYRHRLADIMRKFS